MEFMVEEVLSQLTMGVIVSGCKADGKSIRVKVSGDDCRPVPGEMYRVEGQERRFRDSRGFEWDQLDTDRMDRIETSKALIGPCLQRLPNVGPERARRLTAAFGDKLLEKLKDPEAIGEIAEALDPVRPFLSHRIAVSIVAALTARVAEESTYAAELAFMKRLEEYGVSDTKAARLLWRLIGSLEAEKRLLDKPYLAACVMPWAQADHLGQRLLAQRADVRDWRNHPERLVGAVVSAWRELLSDGHTAATESTLISMLRSRKVNPRLALEEAERALAVRKEGDLYRAPGAAWIEDWLAGNLLDIAEQPSGGYLPDDLEPAIRAAEMRTGLILTEEQRRVAQTLLRSPLGVLQGGAGVGKTVITKILAEVWESLGGNIHLACATGKAALQLTRGASTPSKKRQAFTLTRFTSLVREGNRMTEEALEGDPRGLRSAEAEPSFKRPRIDGRSLVVFDESAMIDTPSLHDAVLLMPPGARLLLVGDHGQLPPVGYGRAFHDLVEDGRFVQTLTLPQRQAADSPILNAAMKIRDGIVPDLPPYHAPDPKGTDGPPPGIFIEKCIGRSQYDAAKQIHKELLQAAERAAQKNGLELAVDDMMVCAALRDTVAWFNGEMAAFRREVHPDLPEVRLGPWTTVAPGDPVICTKTHYPEGLVNGLLGVVASINENREVSILWDGEDASRVLDPRLGCDVELAYSTTCHKNQGSAASWVVVMLERTRLLTREWLYTAATRAKVTVVLVGSEEALAEAVNRRTERVTGFGMVRRGAARQE